MKKIAQLQKLKEEYEELNNISSFNVKEFVNNSIDKLQDFSSVQDCLKHTHTLQDLRFLCRYHLFFLISIIFNRKHLLTEWTLSRCIECQRNPNGYLQLWAREHHKSSIWTIGKTIQDIMVSHGTSEELKDLTPSLINQIYTYLNYEEEDISLDKKFNKIKEHDFNEEVVVGIFSATKTLAEAFVAEIKREFETNDLLIRLFPDVLYKNPNKFSDRWSVQNGICVKRKTVRKESTVEGWGLVVGQPTSKHFTICMFDDIVTHDLVKTIYMNQMVIHSWENAFSLGSSKGAYRSVGTRKHFNDPYSNMIERGAFKPIIYGPFDENGEPVLMTLYDLETRRKNSGEYTYSAEYLQSPLKDSALGFNVDNILTHHITNHSNLCLYMICDPASSVKKRSDYSAFIVFAIDKDQNILLIDGIRDRLNLTDRWNALYKLYNKYKNIKTIFYESVGMNSDMEYFNEKMNECSHFFMNKLEKLTTKDKKQDRISRIEPYIEQKKILFPISLIKQTKDRKTYDLVKSFKEEEIAKYPFPAHDDMLDCLAYCVILLQNGKICSIIDEEGSSSMMDDLLVSAAEQRRLLYGL